LSTDSGFVLLDSSGLREHVVDVIVLDVAAAQFEFLSWRKISNVAPSGRDWLKRKATKQLRTYAITPAAWRSWPRPIAPLRRASEAERRERLRLWVGDISLMPNGTLDGFNHVLNFDEILTHVFHITAIVFPHQMHHDVAAVRNLSISCCDQLLNVLVILSPSGGLLLIDHFLLGLLVPPQGIAA